MIQAALLLQAQWGNGILTEQFQVLLLKIGLKIDPILPRLHNRLPINIFKLPCIKCLAVVGTFIERNQFVFHR